MYKLSAITVLVWQQLVSDIIHLVPKKWRHGP